MTREKKGGPVATAGSHAKDRHKRDRRINIIDWAAPLPPGLVARPAKPQPSSKHKSWFEFMENKGKKKKLEFEFTESIVPPPGFEFVPAGNPALTTKCKELSREQGAMIFIVTSTTGRYSRALSTHLNRVGHHIRQPIVEKARESLGDGQDALFEADPTVPEPIPERQEDIDAQADAAIRDLFPRIPNTDRQMIIQHAFNKSNRKNSEPLVGLAADISLSRRVQLAVLAHIRHNHTRYDQLLRETTYVNARKAVEPVCLDILVKWRGDEETGRDQLDEILYEVVVISDSDTEDEDDDEDDDDEGDSSDTSVSEDAVDQSDNNERSLLPTPREQPPAVEEPALLPAQGRPARKRSRAHAERNSKIARKDRRAAMRSQRGFSRYQAARDRVWQQAIERQRHGISEVHHPTDAMPTDGQANHHLLPSEPPAFPFGCSGFGKDQGLAEQVYPPQSLLSGRPRNPAEGPRNDWERLDYSDVSLPVAPAYGYHPPREAEPRESPFLPIVGQRISPHTESRMEQVRYQSLDLKDHLVRSIEPYSPEVPHFPARFPSQSYPQPGPDVTNAPGAPREQFPPRRNDPPRYVEVERAKGYHVIREQPDFITLTPRHEPDQMRPEPVQPLQPFHGPRSPHGNMRDLTPMDVLDSSGARQPMVYRGDSMIQSGQPALRTESRPIWIRDSGPIPRSEERPVYVEDFQPRPVDPRGGHTRVKSQGDDFVEIVRVSDKFPRQHEPPPIPADPGRYELQPRERQQYESPRPLDGPGRYGFLPGPAQPTRIERVVARVEVDDPRYRHDVMPGIVRRTDEQPGGFQGRQERVVGIEYVPTNSTHDTHYVERPSTVNYEEAEPFPYRRPTGVLDPYSNVENQPPSDQAYSGRDGPVYYGRRY